MSQNELSKECYKSVSIYYFENKSNEICIIDVLKDFDAKKNLGMEDSMSIEAGYCEIPNNRIFYYGGSYGNHVYILDINGSIGIKKPYRKKKYWTNCIYYNDAVYVFGGQDSDTWTQGAESFSLSSEVWKDLEPVPTVPGYTSTVVHDDKILITGRSASMLYSYEPESNRYSALCEFTNNMYKIIIKGLGRVYIFENSKLYESDFGNPGVFSMINNTCVPDTYVVGYSIRNQFCVYFIIKNKKIYKFDLLTKKTYELRPVRFN